MPQTREYQRNYYWAHRERMSAKSLECYYERKKRNSIDPKKEFNRLVMLITTKHAEHDNSQKEDCSS